MREIVPGLVHWTAVHPRINRQVSSYFAVESGALIDPMPAPGGAEALRELGGEPRVALLTNRHHLRGAQEYGVPIRCHEAGLHEFSGSGVSVEPFSWGEEVAPGVHALEVGVICDEESALRVDAADALAIADAVVNYDGLGFVSDRLLGDDPEEIKRGLCASYRRILAEHPAQNVLFAHGDPIVGGGTDALERFLAA